MLDIRRTNWDYMATLRTYTHWHGLLDIRQTDLLFPSTVRDLLPSSRLKDQKFTVSRIRAFMYSYNKSCRYFLLPFSRSYTSSRAEQDANRKL